MEKAGSAAKDSDTEAEKHLARDLWVPPTYNGMPFGYF